MKKNRIDFKEKRRYAIKKVSGKTASVFIGATIFGIILSSNLSIVNTKADTVSNTTATTISNKQTSETSNVGTLRDNQKNENSSNEAAGSVQNVTSNTESNVSAEDKAPSTESATPKSDTQEVSAPAESNANKSAAPAMGMATNTQDTTQDKDKQTNANETTQNTTNVDKKDTEVTPTNDAKTPATQNATNVGNEVTPANGATPLKKFVLAALPVRKAETTETTSVVNPTSADLTTSNNENPSTSLPMSNQDIKLDSQPMLTEISNKSKDNWVYKNMKWYPEYSTGKVKEILQNHTTNDESGRYYFAGAANYNESYHVIYLLARSNNLNDNKLYVTILHTGTGSIQEEVVAPGESKKVEYNGTGGTTHPPIFTNYDGTSVSIDLDGVEKGDKKTYGMVVGFAYGYDTGIYGEPASMGNGFMTTPMPTKVTTTIHYVDQATGDELAVPKSFEGVAYQKYTITGEVPTIDGYTLKKSPNTTGYISPYKVGESYDFRLDKHVVVKQTVIDSQGLVRVTAYYDGEEINNTTRYLGNKLNVNDRMSFVSHGKSYTYINQIISTNDGIVYYYAKDGSEDKSEVRVHYIDVTGNKSSLFVPRDGKEVATDKISGKLGENYNYNVNLPTDYNLATNQANTVNGTYTIDHHDEYVYVVKKTSAEKITPNKPGTKEPVANTSSLTETEKANVQKNVEDANKGNFPDGTTVTVGDDGTATINYKDGSKDTIPGDQLVQGQKGDTTDADKITPTVPGDKVTVKDPSHLTDDEKNQVKNNVDNANKDKFPGGTDVKVGDDGTTTVTYPDGSKDTIPGDQLVQGQKGDTTDADKITPTVPGDKVTVKDPSHLTDDEKNQVKNNVDNANKDKFPGGTDVKVGDDGTTTVTYPDGSKDTIPGDQLVQGQKGDTTDADKITPTVPGDKVTVKDPSHLTDDEKNQVKNNVDNANKDKFPGGTDVKVGDDGTTTVTYPDGSKDTIPGDQLVQGQKGDTTDADKITPTVPGDKVTVKDPSHLTDDEKNQVKNNVDNANKDKFPGGTDVKVGDDGTTTVTYPDGSKDTIPSDQLVQGQKGDTTDADKITPTVPGDKVTVKDPSHLTDSEKDQVKTNVTDANKDNLPSGSQITVGNDGTTTVTYPDGSKDTIPGSDLVRQSTDADKTTPSVPETKVPVADPSHLTDSEKDQVKTNVTDANKDNLPSGSQITVGNDGTTTVTYPDGSKDTIPGDKVLEGKSDVKSDAKSDADKNEPKEPGDKVKVDDPNKLTDSEKEELSNNLEKLNPGTVVTIADDGTATLTYPDGSTNTIPGSQLVTAKGNGNTTNSNVKVTPTNTNNKINKDNNSLGKNTANAKAGELPQTGETNDSQKLSVIGMALMGILGLFGLGKKRKKD
ncbi:LPXTG cell wall anchor domain-containing protein [Ligilactobacillus salivarius]